MSLAVQKLSILFQSLYTVTYSDSYHAREFVLKRLHARHCADHHKWEKKRHKIPESQGFATVIESTDLIASPWP
jgi:hypothetical protein